MGVTENFQAGQSVFFGAKKIIDSGLEVSNHAQNKSNSHFLRLRRGFFGCQPLKSTSHGRAGIFRCVSHENPHRMQYPLLSWAQVLQFFISLVIFVFGESCPNWPLTRWASVVTQSFAFNIPIHNMATFAPKRGTVKPSFGKPKENRAILIFESIFYYCWAYFNVKIPSFSITIQPFTA